MRSGRFVVAIRSPALGCQGLFSERDVFVALASGFSRTPEISIVGVGAHGLSLTNGETSSQITPP